MDYDDEDLTEVIHEHVREPQVETVKDSRWSSYYSKDREMVAPPPKTQEEKKKSKCSPALLALLACLALIGLILALIFALKADTSFGSSDSSKSKT